MNPIEDDSEPFKIYKRPKHDDDDDLPKTECAHSFAKCLSCQKVKAVLLKYQNISESKDESHLSVSIKMKVTNSDGDALGDVFTENYSVVDLLNDYHHIIHQHAVDEDPIQFDKCYDFMVNTDPSIICDVNDCQMVRRHFSRRRNDNQKGTDRADYRMDILRQIHSYFIHSMDTTKLNRIERAQIEEEFKSIANDEDSDQTDEQRMKLVAKKMRQKNMAMESVMGNSKSNRFCTTNEMERNDDGDDEEEKEQKYPENEADQIIKFDVKDESQILDEFCNLTDCRREIGVVFLKDSQWSLPIAVERFYTFSGDATRLESWRTHEDQRQRFTDGAVYTEGIRFWYWNQDRKPQSALSVEKKHENLKEEMLATRHVDIGLWEQHKMNCKVLLQTKSVRKMTANGIGEDIYGILGGAPMQLHFVMALKLYTDFDALNKEFCEHFRQRKLTENEVESEHSLAVRNGNFWNLAKLLTESVQCFGKLLVRKKTRYFRGVNQTFIFPRFAARFYAPLSTSKSVCHSRSQIQCMCTVNALGASHVCCDCV